MSKEKVSRKTNWQEKFAICEKDASGKVIFQNQSCIDFCSRRYGQICTDGCMQLYNEKNLRGAKGTFRFQNIDISDRKVDILMVNDSETILTLIYEITQKLEEDINFYKAFGLTPRELEIVNLVISKQSNSEIADELCISVKTLKTHITNILRKVPSKYWQR